MDEGLSFQEIGGQNLRDRLELPLFGASNSPWQQPATANVTHGSPPLVLSTIIEVFG
jgi:hypothetical protein